MAKRNRNKKKSKNEKLDTRTCAEVALGLRNWVAVSAFQRSGGGTHNDRRTRRQRTRGAQRRAALQDY